MNEPRIFLLEGKRLTLNELVAELDIAKGTLYKHFRSKNELLLELIIQNEKEILKISNFWHSDLKFITIIWIPILSN